MEQDSSQLYEMMMDSNADNGHETEFVHPLQTSSAANITDRQIELRDMMGSDDQGLLDAEAGVSRMHPQRGSSLTVTSDSDTSDLYRPRVRRRARARARHGFATWFRRWMRATKDEDGSREISRFEALNIEEGRTEVIVVEKESKACRWCRMIEGFIICLLIGVISILGLVLSKNLCWTSTDELDLYLSLGKRDDVYSTEVPFPLEHAHSHNDYQQSVPLKLALSAGFCNIEADVYVVNDDLFTGHVKASSNRLEDQYLQPLANLATTKEKGLVNPIALRVGTCIQHTLMVDMKSSSLETWHVLEKLLVKVNRDANMNVFECYNNQGEPIEEPNSVSKRSPIRVVMSGISKSDIPTIAKEMLAIPTHCTNIDGRFEDDGSVSNDGDVLKVQKWISEKWHSSTLAKLPLLVKNAHAVGAKVRFWATDEDQSMSVPELWYTLLKEGVDLISTDRIAGLQAYLLGRKY